MGARLIAGPESRDKPTVASVTERQVCTNLWAYLHWLRATGGPPLGGRDEWRRWANAEPARCAASVRAFAGLPERASPLLNRPHPRGTLVLRNGGTRRSWTADQLARGNVADLPADWSDVLAAEHAPEALTAAAALLLLEADLRPDDCVLLAAGGAWPWAFALREGAVLVDASGESAARLRQAVAEERPRILVASSDMLARVKPAPYSLRVWINPVSREVTVFD
jgi:hypothetical protein